MSIVEYLGRHPDLHNSTNHVDLSALERVVNFLGCDTSSVIIPKIKKILNGRS